MKHEELQQTSGAHPDPPDRSFVLERLGMLQSCANTLDTLLRTGAPPHLVAAQATAIQHLSQEIVKQLTHTQ